MLVKVCGMREPENIEKVGLSGLTPEEVKKWLA